MALVRLRPDAYGAGFADVDTQSHVIPDPYRLYDENDPLVKANRWAFGTEDELAALALLPPITEVRVEAATSNPGESRRARRPK